jgi:hypothetical protein
MKQRPTKLLEHAELIADLEAAQKTLAEIATALAGHGCQVSLSRLSDFMAQQRQLRAQEALLGQIASGARQCKEVQQQFATNPSPQLETLISLHRVLVMKLSTQAAVDPAMIELVTALMKPVMEWAKLKTKQDELSLAREKFQFDAAKAALAKLAELNAIKRDNSLNEDAKLEQARMKLFGEIPA